MRRVVSALVFLSLSISLLAGAPPSHASVSERAVTPHAADADPATITVYVTRTGAKYHRDGCRYLSRSKIAMSLKEAVKRFDPCKVCRPPVI